MDEKVVKEFANKIFQDISSSFSTAMALIGVKNGIFKIMQDRLGGSVFIIALIINFCCGQKSWGYDNERDHDARSLNHWL